MKKAFLILIPIIISLVIACDIKDELALIAPPATSTNTSSSTNTPITTSQTNTNSTQTGTQKTTCNLIAYQDTLYFLENLKDDLKIKPTVSRKGEYGAYPEGLEISESSGEINVTKSESGLRYMVYFIPDKTNDTCFTHLAISGVDYLSKIYLLEKDDKIAPPIYNNNPFLPIPGVSSGKTEFDDGDDDDNGDGKADEPLAGQEVIPQGLDISKLDGKIKLDNSLKKGFLGTNPKSGSTKKVKLFYRLDDNSKKALNRIELEFHYYEKESEVPKSLKDKIIENQSGSINPNFGINYARIFRIFRKPRPPQIVIVGRL